MAAADITQFVAIFVASVNGRLGTAAPTADLTAFTVAAQNLANVASAPPSAAAWAAASDGWTMARDRLAGTLAGYLTDGLPQIPGLDGLLDNVGWSSPEGLHGDLEFGPLKLALAASSLTIQPPALPDGTLLPPVVIGPFQPSGISASISPPFGDGGLPGGGAVMRLPDRSGFGGTLHIPLGPVSVEASAILQELADDTPSFLAVMGVGFTPPIQLSFGFSLDRVGGLVGVNRTVNNDALSLAVRTGAAANALFAVAPPASPAALVIDLNRFFPGFVGRHVIGPTLRLAWLSIGSGSLLALDVGVVIEIPTGKVVILGVARAEIPGAPGLLHLRLDVLGIVDPVESLISIDAGLVDSHLLSVFEVYGNAGLRLSWGGQAYAVISVGGFYPGFNPEPARLPPLRRIGLALDVPVPGLTLCAAGYFAVTTNTIQLGCRLDVSISLGLTAHGFLQVDALVQFRPFYFIANCSAGFDVGVADCSFGGVRLDGTISGPGPLTIRGKLTIETFLFDISWDESFTIGDGPGDTLPSPPRLLEVLAGELAKAENLRPESMHDPAVILESREIRPGMAAVPPTGTLQWTQRRAPLGFPVDRVDGQPLGSPQGAKVATPGAAIPDRFSPGSYCSLTSAEALSRPPFDILTAGIVLAPPAAPAAPSKIDTRLVELIVIVGGVRLRTKEDDRANLAWLDTLVVGSRGAPALSDAAPLVKAEREEWATVSATGSAEFGYASATAAHQFARQRGRGAVALAAADVLVPVDLAGI